MALLHLGEARRKEGLDGCHPRRIRHRRLNSSRRPAGEGKRVLAGKRPPRHLRLRRRIQVGTGTGRCGIATCGSGRNAGCARQTAAASGGVQECSRGGSEKGAEKAEDGGMSAPTAHCGCAAAAAAAIAALTRAAALTRRAAYSCEEARTAGAECDRCGGEGSNPCSTARCSLRSHVSLCTPHTSAWREVDWARRAKVKSSEENNSLLSAYCQGSGERSVRDASR